MPLFKVWSEDKLNNDRYIKEHSKEVMAKSDPCHCKIACSIRGKQGSARGCPCRGEDRLCNEACRCGKPSKPCQNKLRIIANQQVKEFIDTLDSATVKKLCIRSLRRGIGSMDYIDSLLIMEDDLDDANDHDKDAKVYSPAAEAGVEI
ncbi:uncharacterized protein LOC141896404 [Acropora palmata]|uniref:uncharacterized protein LOC141896404 n=1 Tax=Acropora palmata TaxID=6131 RepID=UPI003DA15433